MKLVKIVTIIISLLCNCIITVNAAEETFRPAEEPTQAEAMYIIQNSSDFPLTIRYMVADKYEARTIEPNQSEEIDRQIKGLIEIWTQQRQWSDILPKISRDTLAVAASFLKNPANPEEAILKRLNKTQQTGDISQSYNYPANTVFVFYWPLVYAVAHYDPLIFAVKRDAVEAWNALRKSLENYINISKTSAENTYKLISKLEAETRLNPATKQTIDALNLGLLQIGHTESKTVLVLKKMNQLTNKVETLKIAISEIGAKLRKVKGLSPEEIQTITDLLNEQEALENEITKLEHEIDRNNAIKEMIEKFQEYNVPEKDREILLAPLPQQFHEFQDQYDMKLLMTILTYEDSRDRMMDPNIINIYIYYTFHQRKPASSIYHSLGIRFLILSQIFNIDPKELRPEHVIGGIQGIYFGQPENLKFIPVEESTKAILDGYIKSKKLGKEMAYITSNAKALEEITANYKIHLNPTDQFMDYIVCKLLELKSQNKEFFDQHKIVLKIKLAYCAARETHLTPLIVIYAHGKQVAQETLNFIYDNFKDDRTGCDWAPAFNEKVTDLVYVAQGDRDIKKIGTYQECFEGKGREFFKGNQDEFYKNNLAYYKTGLTYDAELRPVNYRLKNPAR